MTNLNVRRTSALLAAALGVAVVTVTLSAASASAIQLTVSPNAALSNHATRSISDFWSGGTGHYKLNFNCDNPGCANLALSSSTMTSLSRTNLHTTDCGGAVSYSLMQVWDDEGRGTKLTGQTTTTWARTTVC